MASKKEAANGKSPVDIKVDIVSYREKMNPFLKHRIDREALYA
jgi:hypothetical protein